jgi:disulfide bond formation protein DsbB
MSGSRSAPAFLFAVSGALVLGALGFQFIGGLAPCEMCHWQRWAHLAVMGVAGLGWLTGNRALGWLAIFAMAGSAGLGLFHAGVELKWWPGVTACASPVVPGMSMDAMMDSLLAAPLARCDEIPWSLLGVSMAGWNALVSAGAALCGAMLMLFTAKRAQ